MQAYRMHVTVPEDRRTLVKLPNTVPTGEVELIVLVSEAQSELRETANPEALARWDAAAGALARDPRPFRELTVEERRARLRHLRGIGKGLLPSSEEFLRQKREEIELEEGKFGG